MASSYSTDVLRAPYVNAYSALALPDYWRGVTFISDNLASFGRSVTRDGAKLDQPHPLDRLLKRRPNATQPAFPFFRDLFHDAVHRHNAYAWIQRDEQYAPVALHNLEVADVTPVLVYSDPQDVSTASLYYWHAPSRRALPSADVIHLRANRGDGLAAHAPTQVHAQTFEIAQLVAARTSRALRRGTSIIGAVEIPQDATAEQTDEIVDTLKQFRAPDSDRDLLVLKGGAKLNNQALNPQQMQLIEQQAALTKRIAQVLGLDPVYLFDRSESQYVNNAEQSGQDLVRFTFRVWIELIESELSAKLLSEDELDQDYKIRLNPDALLRGSTEVQAQVVTTLTNGGMTTPNEGRATLGLPDDPSPDSDKLREPHAVASAPAPTVEGDAK